MFCLFLIISERERQEGGERESKEGGEEGMQTGKGKRQFKIFKIF